ncbi:MAG: MaoC/PaaZ C-terminal domain-containing protein [Polyangiaceae bacterium]
MPFDMSIVGKPTEAKALTYTWKDVVLYALGIGAKKDELDFLYEGKGPKVIPSFAVVPKFTPLLDALSRCGGNMAMVVHGGERVRIKKPFAPEATVKTTATIRGIYDMKRFANVLVDTTTTDAKGEVVAETTSSILFRGEGGFDGELPPKEDSGIALPKDRSADFRIEEATTAEQALLYRLSGDLNPLHADPDFATMVGFPQGPILHGLCTYGHMVRHVAKGATKGDATRITGFEAQFRKPVWPGDTIVTEGWIVEPGKIALQVSVKERNEVVIGGAWATTLVD